MLNFSKTDLEWLRLEISPFLILARINTFIHSDGKIIGSVLGIFLSISSQPVILKVFVSVEISLFDQNIPEQRITFNSFKISLNRMFFYLTHTLPEA